MNRPNYIWNTKWDGPDKVSKTVLTKRLNCLSKNVFHESFDDFMKQFTLPYECCSAMIVMMVCVCPTEGLNCRCDSRSCNSNPNCNPNTFIRSLTCTCKLDLAPLGAQISQSSLMQIHFSLPHPTITWEMQITSQVALAENMTVSIAA